MAEHDGKLVVSGLPISSIDCLLAVLPRVTVLYAVDSCRRNIRFEAQGCNVHNGIARKLASQRLPSQPPAPSPRGATRYVLLKGRKDLQRLFMLRRWRSSGMVLRTAKCYAE